MAETAKQKVKVAAPKVAALPEPNPELQAKYKDLYKRQREHATVHDSCDKSCDEARKMRLELKALDGEAKKLHAANGNGAKAVQTPAPAPEEQKQAIKAAAKPKKVAPKVAAVPALTEAQVAKVKADTEKALANPLPKAKSTPKAKVAKAVKPVAEAPKAKAEPKAKAVKVKAEPKAPPAPTDFLMYVGGAFYTKEQFIQEAQEMGVSKRLPTFRIPPDMVVGKSRIWLAEGGERKASEKGKLDKPEAHSHIFGYFIPDAIEFIAGEDGDKTFADIIGYLKTVEGAKVVQGNPATIFKKRLCGERKVGGTYLVTKEGEGKKSPIVLLDKELPYIGNHFRGLMRLEQKAITSLEKGEGLTTLVQDQCMRCHEEVLVAPDSRKRAAVERRRQERGEEPKWFLECAECRNARHEEERKAREAEKAAMADAEATEEVADAVDAQEGVENSAVVEAEAAE